MRLEPLHRALDKWKPYSQLLMWFEESAELSKEIAKWFRGEDNITNIKEEMADVLIMVEQMKIIFNIGEKELQDRIEYKLKRLEERLDT